MAAQQWAAASVRLSNLQTDLSRIQGEIRAAEAEMQEHEKVLKESVGANQPKRLFTTTDGYVLVERNQQQGANPQSEARTWVTVERIDTD